jgi:sulfate permease, SulP family
MVAAGAAAPPCPQVAMLRLRGSIYFGAVEHVRDALHRIDEADPHRKWVLLMAQGVNFVDLAGAQLLAEEARRRRALGGALFIVGAQPAVRPMLERSEQIADIGTDRLIAHKGDALRAVYPLLDSRVCRDCRFLVFEECHRGLPDGTARPESTGPPTSPAPHPSTPSTPTGHQPTT